jgi:hypothetical protein
MAAADPISQTATRIAGSEHQMLEHRLKRDMFEAIVRVKPAVADGVSIEDDVLSGQFFETLTPALQGIAVVKLENAISYYDRIGWRDAWLEMPLESALSGFQIEKITEKTQPRNMHDVSYISHKHIEKMLGKIEAAKLWEQLKAWQPDS